MRIGLLARADERGIAHQTREFFLHMKPHRTLVMMLNDPAWPEDSAKYQSGQGVDYCEVDPRTRVLDGRKIAKVLRDVDVLFAVETLMDWGVADLAREYGVRTVVQGNPEFYVHPHFPIAQPDTWVWPTSWLIDELPQGQILPVPVPDHVPVAAGSPDGRLRVLHVAGHAAAGDRNGTVDFMESLQYITRPCTVTVVGQDHWLPEARPSKHVELILIPKGVPDRWSMYANQNIVVLPRKYGGLCLPAQEASAVGCAVIMPDCSPNEMWPGPRLISRKGRLHRAPSGPIQTYNVDPRHIAHVISHLEINRGELHEHQTAGFEWAKRNTWTKLYPHYLAAFS